MTLSLWFERIKNKLIYSFGVHFPYSKVRNLALRKLGHQIGNNVYFSADIVITQNFTGDRGKLYIGNNVAIGPRCTLVVVSHPNYSQIRALIKEKKAEIIIEDNVWIGAGAIILPEVTIGANSIIAAGAVVTKSVAPNSIIGGIPAKHLKNSIKNEDIN